MESIYKIILSRKNNKNKKFKVYNIGSNNPIKLTNFISIIEKKIKKVAKKNFLPLQKGDIPKTHSDNNKFIRDYKFKPITSHEEGISKFIDWYLDYYKK